MFIRLMVRLVTHGIYSPAGGIVWGGLHHGSIPRDL